MSRATVLKSLFCLENVRLIHGLHKPSKGIGALTKPDKIYLNNTNLLFALAPQNAQADTLRETFFINQVSDLHKVHLSTKGDFLVDEKYTFEIGGRNRTSEQIAKVSNSFLAKDEVETGVENSIPLWLFGFWLFGFMY